MVILSFVRNKNFQYIFSVTITILTSLICFIVSDYIGYKTVALILLLMVSLLAILLDVVPVLLSALLSALIWDFFFIPPHYTFHVDTTEDALMLLMYFIIALVNGVLTTRLRKIEKISQNKEEKIKSIKLYDTLFNSISHELRTPIAAIYGSADNLLNNYHNLSEENKNKLISGMHGASEKLNNLIGNLLNISRLETGQLSIKKDWCNLSELVNSAITTIQQEYANSVIISRIDENFPLVKLDYGLMEQVIYNISHNSLVHNNEQIEITISCSLKNKNLIIEISDNGLGIPEDEIEKIFDKFYSIKNKTGSGTGLGLSVAKGFIEAHNGKIKASNNEGKGVTFSIFIPYTITDIFQINKFKNEL